jgi:hypothetical protein
MPPRRLRDLMPKRPRYHEQLPDPLRRRAMRLYERLGDVPFISKQDPAQWQERFCYSSDAEREIAVWEWLAGQYEVKTAGIDREEERNRIFKELLTAAIDYEPLGVRKLPAE